MENCKQCGSLLKHVPAGFSVKKQKSYNAFDVCPKGCKQGVKTTSAPNVPAKNLSNEHVQLMNFVGEEFANLNKRLDAMGRYLKSQLEKSGVPTPQGDEVDIRDIHF